MMAYLQWLGRNWKWVLGGLLPLLGGVNAYTHTVSPEVASMIGMAAAGLGISLHHWAQKPPEALPQLPAAHWPARK